MKNVWGRKEIRSGLQKKKFGERDHLEDLGTDTRILSKWILCETGLDCLDWRFGPNREMCWAVVDWTDLAQDGDMFWAVVNWTDLSQDRDMCWDVVDWTDLSQDRDMCWAVVDWINLAEDEDMLGCCRLD